MYKDKKTDKPIPTWNPFKGCDFNCVYCEPSFKRQAKRQKHNCKDCYNYKPHFHPERLNKIPKANLVFACGNGDISFADIKQKALILRAMQLKPKQTFLLQTKNPECLENFRIPSNVIVGTTIETNRDTREISKAPLTLTRYNDICVLSCRKSVTIEPIMNFDLDVMIDWLWAINPEIVWVGYNNYPESIYLVEPTLEKTNKLIDELNTFTDVRLKTIRSIKGKIHGKKIRFD